MTFNEIYKDNNEIFSKVYDIILKNNVPNNLFCKYVCMSDEEMYLKYHNKARNMAIRVIFMHILITFIIPFSIMSFISKFVNISLFMKWTPTIFINIMFMLYISKFKDIINKNVEYIEKYKNKNKQNDLKGILELRKEEIHEDNLNLNIMYKHHFINKNNFNLYDMIFTLYFGINRYELVLFTSNMDYIITFRYIKLKFNDLLCDVNKMIAQKFVIPNNIPKEEDFIDFLNKKFAKPFIKSIFDNVKYDSRIDNLIVLLYFMNEFIKIDETLENGDRHILFGVIPYNNVKTEPEILEKIATEFISYQILKYGLEKEGKENLLRQ